MAGFRLFDLNASRPATFSYIMGTRVVSRSKLRRAIEQLLHQYYLELLSSSKAEADRLFNQALAKAHHKLDR